MPRLAGILFLCGWFFGLMGALDIVNEYISLIMALLSWFSSVIILIWERVKKYQNKHLILQSKWDEYEGDQQPEFSALPNPSEFDLDIPL